MVKTVLGDCSDSNRGVSPPRRDQLELFKDAKDQFTTALNLFDLETPDAM
jgi:hypothetical protein